MVPQQKHMAINSPIKPTCLDILGSILASYQLASLIVLYLRPCLVSNFFCKIEIVSLSFVFDKYYPIMY